MTEEILKQEVKVEATTETKPEKKDFKNKKPEQRKNKDTKKEMTFTLEETLNQELLNKLKKIK